jgi:ABC-type phosphate transport system substrate-binding protein
MRRSPTFLRVLAMSVLATATLAACGRDPGSVALPDCLDLGAVYALTGPESIGAFSWSSTQALAEELGSTQAADFPDAALTIYGPGEESGTFDSFNELAIVDTAEARGVPEDEALVRPDYISSPNDNVIIDGVAGSAGSFGWVGHAFAESNADAVRTFAVAGEDGRCISPTSESISAGRYPLARDLYVYVNLDSVEGDAAVRAYIDELLSDDGRTAVEEVGYVPLADDAWAETLAAWSAIGGRPGEAATDVEGDVQISGSSTVEPITSLVAGRFGEANPAAGVSVDGPGTGDGFELFCDGETDISDASRPIEPEEAATCEAAGIDFVELKIGIDGLSLVTRRDGRG